MSRVSLPNRVGTPSHRQSFIPSTTFNNNVATSASTSAAASSRQLRRKTFPLLDTREITACLQEYEFDVTLEQINRPTSSFITGLCKTFVEIFMAIDDLDSVAKQIISRNLKQQQQQQQDEEEGGAEQQQRQNYKNQSEINGNGVAYELNGNGISEPEVELTPSSRFIILFKFSKRFFHNINVSDFTISDLSKPDPFRIRRLLSAVVNYIRFRETNSQIFDSMAAEAEQKTQAVKQQQADIQILHDQIKDLDLKIKFENDGKSNVPRTDIQHAHNYNKKLETKLRHLKAEQEKLTRQHDEYKTEKSSMANKLHDLSFLCDEVQGEIENLKAYQNTDIEVLQKITNDLKEEAETRNAECKRFEQQYQNLGKTIDSIQVNKVKMREILKLSEELKRTLQQQESESVQLSKKRDQLLQLQAESEDLANQILICQKQLEKTSKKYTDLTTQQEKKQVALQAKLDEAKEKLKEMFASQSEQRDSHQMKIDEISQISKETDLMNEAFEKEMKASEVKLNQLNSALKYYMNELNEKLTI
ncbi:kinetochore-associated Ndc80 complex subunit nuf2 [Lodderomyces elongisporus]|uniref:kinetochore-associated Ndc80 complex subunit nuf2 n=1 Tax=Lodderomyces elongisporus TaxID=36914 RepID=UPI00291D68F0|nr:kinetochore-associated Ndc80 complex subunit nuf2 [Lodderomyces elongisporus]WLF80825.1 kinetochore-associated Ndc80 complex subunit nuf2 [Lodderomyces elongisporus]